LAAGSTDGLKRLAARSVGFGSYRLAAENLYEYCGIRLSHTTVGEIAHQTSEELAAKLPDNSEIRNDFQKAKGEAEFRTAPVSTPGTTTENRNG